MRSKVKQLAVLKEITELKSEISRARLAGHRTEIQRLEDEIEAVERSRAEKAPETLHEAASIARYDAWAAQRRRDLRGDLAMAMARAQPVKETAARDEARAQVVTRLVRQLKKPGES